MTAAELMVKVGADVDGAVAGVNRVDQSVKGFSSSMRRGVLLAGAGVATGIGLAVKSAADFQTTLNTFKAVSGATGDEMGKVSAKAVALGNDMTLPGTSASDAATAMTELAKGGLSVQQSMDAAKGVLQLSAAAQIDNATAATITARALNAFGLNGKQAVTVADQLAAASNASTAEISDLALGMQASSAVFRMGRQPIDTLTTSLALMANAGITGSDAGTSLKTMMLRLEAPTKRASKVLDGMNIHLRDQQGHMLPLRNIIGQFSRATKGMSDAQRDAAFNTIFGTDAIRSANVILAGGVQAYDKMHTAVMKHGAAADLASAKMKGLNGAIEAAKSTAETAALIFGGMLVGPLTVLAQVLGTVFGVISQHQAIFAPLLAVLGTLMTEIFLVVGAVKAWAVAQALLNVVLDANPILLIAGALVALVAGLIVAYQHCAAFRDIVNAAFDAIRSVAVPVLQWLAANVPGIWETIKADTVAVWNAIVAIFTSVWGRIHGIVQTELSTIVALIRALLTEAKGVVNIIMGLIHGDWSRVWEGIKQVTSGALQAIVALIRGVMGIAAAAARALGTAILDGIVSILKTLAGKVGAAFGALWSLLKGLVGRALSAGAEIGSAIMHGIANGITSAVGSAVSAVTGAVGSVLSHAKGLLHINSPSLLFAQEVGAPISEGIARGITDAVQHPVKAVQDAITHAIEGGKKTGGAAFEGLGAYLSQHLKAGFGQDPNAILSPFKDAKYATDDWASTEGADNMRGVGAGLAQALADGFGGERGTAGIASGVVAQQTAQANAPFEGVIRPGQAGLPDYAQGGLAGEGGSNNAQPPNVTVNVAGSVLTDHSLVETVRREIYRIQGRNGSSGFK